MSFDVERLVEHCINVIEEFAEDHQDETFYAFAIDANLLCFNSIERFRYTQIKYKEDWDRKTRLIESWDDMTEKDHKGSRNLLDLAHRYKGLNLEDKEACLMVINERRQMIRNESPINPYLSEERISDLRANTGDWEYQGFAEMTEENGFDQQAYYIHYDLNSEEQLNSEYGLAMDDLVEKLIDSGVFNNLNLTNDFYAIRVEHNY